MTDAERREAARQFYNKWAGRGREDEDDRSYWLDILERILGVENATDHIDFQKKVVVDGNTKRIDAYIPETGVLIEQKTLGIPLDKKINQSGGIMLTPYEQAKRYNDNLPYDERARWIVTSNFSEIWIYDMNAKVPEPVKLQLDNLQAQYASLDFLIKKEVQKVNLEMEISLQAGEIVGRLYDAFLRQYKEPDNSETLKSLNKLCVRIVFCLYAEDAGIFGRRNMFHDYMRQFSANTARKGLRELFQVLDQKQEERDEYLADDDPLLASFPYVNGGLFSDENIEIPPLTDEILRLILENASDDFDWSKISPTIFGAVFESTLNPETRRSGGMHYTSIENIHKVIDPLFLDDLRKELDEITSIDVIRTKRLKLETYQNKIASLSFLDPACGSGNFLTETYLSLRRLENRVIRMLYDMEKGQVSGQISFADETMNNPIKVSISQFYGIEINDFAVTVAKTALWIAESQMMKETEDVVHMNLDFLPLKTNAHIVEGNALRIDWNSVISAERLSYIMGNPPFVGARLMSAVQKEDVFAIFNSVKNNGNLDYVSCWYQKATDMMKGTSIRTALVSTNSITQGEQVSILWKNLMGNGVHIDFAYRTFLWDSEASLKAHVHCVIVGFSVAPNDKGKRLYDKGKVKIVDNINGYLVEAENIFIGSRTKPLCDIPEIGIGNKPIDGGHYLFTEDEMVEFVKKEPKAKQYFKKWLGSKEFINGYFRYCLWLGECSPKELRSMPECLKRVEAVKRFRLESTSAGTRKLAANPTHFHVENMPRTNYILIPEVSSERRRYVPMGFMTPEVLCSNLVKIVPDATLYHFGILTSNVHMAWMRAVCGRLKSDYRYSKDVVYNNFPWPSPTEEQRKKIEQTARQILDARKLYPDDSLADLYDPLTMPPELRKAHAENDKAVMNAYGFSVRNMSEEDCVAEQMKLYQMLTKKNT